MGSPQSRLLVADASKVMRKGIEVQTAELLLYSEDKKIVHSVTFHKVIL
jgi:hypothetical protein